MNKAYSWYRLLDFKDKNLRIPHTLLFGGSQINSPIYYHDAKVRSDSPHFLFQYTLSGIGIFRYDGNEHELKAGQGFLCCTHDPKMAYYYPPEGKDTYEMLYLCFGGDLDTFEEITELYGRVFELSLDSEIITRILSFRVRSHYSEVLQSSLSESINIASSLITSLIGCKESESKSSKYDIINQAQVYILEHIEDKLSVKVLANIFGVTPNHISRGFKAHIGISPHKYISMVRMKHAAKLINSNLLSVKEVAFRMGHDNAAHFIRSFKRVHGYTPGSLRK
jgi:AraC-like DNA-binding protein